MVPGAKGIDRAVEIKVAYRGLSGILVPMFQSFLEQKNADFGQRKTT